MWHHQYSVAVLLLLVSLHGSLGLEDGLARTPPMGYRTWNSYDRNVNQTLMVDIIDFVTSELTIKSTGAKFRLRDVGYTDVGLDDFWQACGKGYKGSFHDKDGRPMVNLERFPDMLEMNRYAHRKGVTSGWYFNNCICAEKTRFSDDYIDKHYTQSVQALRDFEFDSVKLDNCGIYTDLDRFAKLFKDSGRPIMIENCHWGQDLPTLSHCPFHMYRSSADIRSTWESMMSNIETMVPLTQLEKPLSRPGCWAYPDMLEVGLLANADENRAHFALWCITSSPLIMSFVIPPRITGKPHEFDISSPAIQSTLEILANKLAIQVNQEWAGHPGTRIASFQHHSKLSNCGGAIQVWGKPLLNNRIAIVVVNAQDPNTCTDEANVTFSLAEVLPPLFMSQFSGACESAVSFSYQDVWDGKVNGPFRVSEKVSWPRLKPHSSSFVVASATCNSATS